MSIWLLTANAGSFTLLDVPCMHVRAALLLHVWMERLKSLPFLFSLCLPDRFLLHSFAGRTALVAAAGGLARKWGLSADFFPFHR
jgi:hypothetical protein